MIDTGAAAPTTAEPVRRFGAVAIDGVERAVVGALDGPSLVGEVDRDSWGPLAEEMLRDAVRSHPLTRIGRVWPATLATYLVHQGIHRYEVARFWDNLSIPSLRHGTSSGSRFYAERERLGLRIFDDLEVFDQMGVS